MDIMVAGLTSVFLKSVRYHLRCVRMWTTLKLLINKSPGFAFIEPLTTTLEIPFPHTTA